MKKNGYLLRRHQFPLKSTSHHSGLSLIIFILIVKRDCYICNIFYKKKLLVINIKEINVVILNKLQWSLYDFFTLTELN